MNEQDIDKRFMELVAEILPPDPQRPPVSRETKLLQDPAIDSLTMSSLGFSVSAAFGIGTSELVALIPQFQNVGDALVLIKDELRKTGQL